MTHEERMAIAEELAQRIVSRHGDNVTAIAAYGSVAKNEDGPHSDLDLWVASREVIEGTRFFVYRGLPISINYDTEEGRLKLAGRVTPQWPIDADELRQFIILFERGDFTSRLREAASNLRDEDFRKATQTLMARLCETTNKLTSAWDRRDHYGVLEQGRSLARGVAMVMGLVNKQYYPSWRGFYQTSKRMERQPRDYAHLLDLVGGFTTLDAEQVYSAGMELWANLCELVAEAGVEWQSGKLQI